MNTVEKLILEVKKYEYLYNSNHKDYNDVRKKKLTWKKISYVLNLNVVQCQRKWKNLRDSFVRKTEIYKTSEGQNKRIWPFYESMSFLFPYVQSRRTADVFCEDDSAQNSILENDEAASFSSSSGSSLDAKGMAEKLPVNKKRPQSQRTILPKKSISESANPLEITWIGSIDLLNGNGNKDDDATGMAEELPVNRKRPHSFRPILPKISTVESLDPLEIPAMGLLDGNKADGPQSFRPILPQNGVSESADPLEICAVDLLEENKDDRTQSFLNYVGEKMKKLNKRKRKELEKKIFDILYEYDTDE